jgi:chromosome partitioning protein
MTHVLAILATKGGCSKSSLATALAVRAVKDDAHVALLDGDPQESLTNWWERRGSPGNPEVFSIEDPTDDVAQLRRAGFDWIVIDGPPSDQNRIGRLTRVSDFVLIPARVSAFDLDAVAPVVDHCQRFDKPFAFVLTHIDTRWEKFTASAIKALKITGPVLAEQMRFRLAYASAVTVGKTGPESSDSRQAAEARTEIDAIWLAIKKRMGVKPGKA